MGKIILITVIFLILISIDVAASSFTGAYSDYGEDTNSDTYYEFLVVNVGVSITAAGDYSIFGILEDSNGNSQEYDECKTYTTGTKTFPLRFDGTEIYLNKVNGPYDLSYIELNHMTNGCSGQPPASPDDSRNDPYTTSYYTYTEFQPLPETDAGAYCFSSPCIANTIECAGNDELNNPNTIDNCYDSDLGTCHVDESIENITITNLNNIDFNVNDEINIEIWVHCSSTLDHLNFIYTSNSINHQWQYKGHEYCPTTGFVKFSKNLILDNIEGNHTIRGVFELGGSTQDTCGSASNWADNDDVMLYVKEKANKISIPLNTGWNLISIPSIENNNSIENIFSGINYGKIIAFNASNKKYYMNDKTNLFALKEINLQDGYWIKVLSDGSLEIDYSFPNNVVFQLKKGWNLIGFPSNKSLDINSAFLDGENYIDNILSYENNSWFSFNFNKNHNTLSHLNPGKGYWLNAKEEITMTFNGNNFVFGKIAFEIPLYEDWNLISIPLILENNSIDYIFKDITYSKIFSFVNNKYIELDVNDNINNTMGLWIKVPANDILVVEGLSPENTLINLNNGLNLIGYPSLTEKNVGLVFNNINDSLNNVLSYENGLWYSYNPKKSNNSLETMKPGYGYWVDIN